MMKNKENAVMPANVLRCRRMYGEMETIMFLEGLDLLDQKILLLLIQNARMSYSDIGKQVGISRVAVKMRVQAMEQKGIIE